MDLNVKAEVLDLAIIDLLVVIKAKGDCQINQGENILVEWVGVIGFIFFKDSFAENEGI